MSQDLIIDAEKKASLRHFLSAAMIFSTSWPKEPVTAEQKAHGDAMYARALTAFDEWFSLHEAHPQKLAAPKALEPVAWSTVHRAVCMAVEQCKSATGQRSHIDLVVNTAQITHDILGTDTSIAAPHSGRATDAGSSQP